MRICDPKAPINAALLKSMKLTPFLSGLATGVLLASPIQSPSSEVHRHPGWTTYVLDFTAFPDGLSTPFSETVDELDVNYSGISGAFTAVDATPTPVLRGEPGAHWLDITFSEKMFGIGFDYITFDPGSGPIIVEFFEGDTLVKTVPWPDPYPEGFFSHLPVCICPNFFDRVVIADTFDSSFAIQQLTVVHSTPDSGFSLSFLIIALCGIFVLRRSCYTERTC